MRITVRVTPNAKDASLTVRDDGQYLVRVPEPPEHGRATEAVRRLVADRFRVSASRVSLVMGASSRVKVFDIR